MPAMNEGNSLNTPADATQKTGSPAGAALSDDTSLSAEVAALYLRLTPAELAEAHKSKRASPPARERVDAGAKANAQGQSQPALYKLGALREFGKTQPPGPSFEAVAKAGILGWMSAKLPFFAELEPRVKRGRRVLIGSAWDVAGPEREAHFADLVAGRIRCAWITSSEAATSLWSDEASHRAFAARGLALLEGEARAIEAAVGATQRLGVASSAAAS